MTAATAHLNNECAERPSGFAFVADRAVGVPVGHKLRWTVCGGIHGKRQRIPAVPGIYAYAEVTRVAGLPVSMTWVYIGQSINLQQRILNGHDVRFEKNNRLRAWMRRTRCDAELWFAPVDAADLDVVERDLVAAIKPAFNSHHK